MDGLEISLHDKLSEYLARSINCFSYCRRAWKAFRWIRALSSKEGVMISCARLGFSYSEAPLFIKNALKTFSFAGAVFAFITEKRKLERPLESPLYKSKSPFPNKTINRISENLFTYFSLAMRLADIVDILKGDDPIYEEYFPHFIQAINEQKRGWKDFLNKEERQIILFSAALGFDKEARTSLKHFYLLLAAIKVINCTPFVFLSDFYKRGLFSLSNTLGFSGLLPESLLPKENFNGSKERFFQSV